MFIVSLCTWTSTEVVGLRLVRLISSPRMWKPISLFADSFEISVGSKSDRSSSWEFVLSTLLFFVLVPLHTNCFIILLMIRIDCGYYNSQWKVPWLQFINVWQMLTILNLIELWIACKYVVIICRTWKVVKTAI